MDRLLDASPLTDVKERASVAILYPAHKREEAIRHVRAQRERGAIAVARMIDGIDEKELEKWALRFDEVVRI
jgi:hypothetical protein